MNEWMKSLNEFWVYICLKKELIQRFFAQKEKFRKKIKYRKKFNDLMLNDLTTFLMSLEFKYA